MSESHLKVGFRESTGMPVHQYLIRRRVERAALLLREGELPINQIALEVGFAHQSHLALHVTRLLGVSPRQLISFELRSSGIQLSTTARLVYYQQPCAAQC
jgi:AraC family transcriptional regulator